MYLNSEQLDAFKRDADIQKEKFRETLKPKVAELFSKTESLSKELARNNLPHLFVMYPRKDNACFRFSHFFSKKFKDTLSKEAGMNCWAWSQMFGAFCIEFLKVVCGYQIKLYNQDGGLIFDSSETPD